MRAKLTVVPRAAIFHQIDVSKGPGEMQRLMRACCDTFGKLDGLFNNAGIAEDSGAADGVADNAGLARLWAGAEAVMETNVLSCIWGVQAAAPLMAAGGAIVNNSSVAAGSSLGSGTTSPLCEPPSLCQPYRCPCPATLRIWRCDQRCFTKLSN